jgi:hypothetical protein
MAPDPLGVAETERDHAVQALTNHMRTCPRPGACDDCLTLSGHADRTQHQVELLGGPAPESEVLW